MMQLLSLLGILIGVGLVVLLLWRVSQNARRLNQRIQKHKAEVEEREKQGIPFNPFLELSQLYQEEAETEVRPKRRHPKKNR